MPPIVDYFLHTSPYSRYVRRYIVQRKYGLLLPGRYSNTETQNTDGDRVFVKYCNMKYRWSQGVILTLQHKTQMAPGCYSNTATQNTDGARVLF